MMKATSSVMAALLGIAVAFSAACVSAKPISLPSVRATLGANCVGYIHATEVHLLAPRRTVHAAIASDNAADTQSPDGTMTAVQSASGVTVYRGQTEIRSVKNARLPSWLDSATVAYLLKSNRYELFDVASGRSRVFKPVGKPFRPLRHSRIGMQLMYATRTRGDFWAPLSEVERYRVVVHAHEQAPGVIVGYGYKGNPADPRFIDNPAICDLPPET
jgi:hypothetical protein